MQCGQSSSSRVHNVSILCNNVCIDTYISIVPVWYILHVHVCTGMGVQYIIL